MRVFECPSCRAKLQAADEHIGKSIECPQCKQLAIVPAAADAITVEPAGGAITPTAPVPLILEPAPATAVTTPDNLGAPAKPASDYDDDHPRRRDRRDAPPPSRGMGTGAILAIVFGVLICVVGPVMVALLVPAVQKVREAAARSQSINNLKQITLAAHGYHDTFKMLPFNGTNVAVANNSNSGSWGFQILPFVEQQGVFATVNRNAGIPVFLCPGRGRPPVELASNGGGAWSDYFINNYINDARNAANPGNANQKMTLAGITDGPSNTVLFGHGNITTSQYASASNVTLSSNIFLGGTFGTARAGNNAGAGQPNGPGGVTLQRDSMVQQNIGGWGGPFPAGALIAMGDGSVRTVSYQVQNFGIFLTPNGGEGLMPDW